MGSRPAVFIDRDGTLTEEVGYVNHPSRLPTFTVPPDHVADDLCDAVDWVLSRRSP